MSCIASRQTDTGYKQTTLTPWLFITDVLFRPTWKNSLLLVWHYERKTSS